jgi:hypothetical protein
MLVLNALNNFRRFFHDLRHFWGGSSTCISTVGLSRIDPGFATWGLVRSPRFFSGVLYRVLRAFFEFFDVI